MTPDTPNTTNDLILAHLWIVKSLAHKLKSSLLFSADWDELIAAGNLGLVKAARNFEARNHCQFRTYAYKCVRGEMIKSFTRIDGHHDSARVEFVSLDEMDQAVQPTQESDYYDSERRAILQQRLAQLDQRHRYVIDLYLRGDSIVAYARDHHWSRDRVMKWQRTGIRQLCSMS